MSGMGEIYRDMTANKKERHKEWKTINTDIIESSGLKFESTNNGETILFREHEQIKVDFYPSTGRWKFHGKMFRGGARQFLNWYKKQIIERVKQ